MFPGADVALDQDVVVRGGGDVVVWLYREEGGADSVVGEVSSSLVLRKHTPVIYI